RFLAVIAICFASALVAAAQNNPSPSDQTQIVEKAREVALGYTANLPNFICTDTTRRSQPPRRSQTWKLLDTIAVDVAFSDQGDRYNLITNGKPTRKISRKSEAQSPTLSLEPCFQSPQPQRNSTTVSLRSAERSSSFRCMRS